MAWPWAQEAAVARSPCYGTGTLSTLVRSFFYRLKHGLTSRVGFLAESWHITSSGMFAGSCIGVIFLVVSLEFLRRVQREYNRSLQQNRLPRLVAGGVSSPRSDSSEMDSERGAVGEQTKELVAKDRAIKTANSRGTFDKRNRLTMIKQQGVRAVIHSFQFAVAYIIMLLAMSYNGKWLDSQSRETSMLITKPTARLHYHLHLHRSISRLLYL